MAPPPQRRPLLALAEELLLDGSRLPAQHPGAAIRRPGVPAPGALAMPALQAALP
jgi:hypothetical protein